MRTRIAINGRYTRRRVTGVERYAAEISSRLGQGTRFIQPKRRLGGLVGHAWEQLVLPARVGSDELLWSPANTGPLSVRRQVVSIHDLVPIEHPEWFSASFSTAYRYLLPELARQAAGLITVSQHTKIRIQTLWQISDRQICVAPGGVDMLRFRPASLSEQARVRRKYGIMGEYVLFVGTKAPQKNLIALLRAWEELSPRHATLALVIAGGRSGVHRYAKIDRQRRWISHRHYIHLNYIPESDLNALYTNAKLYVQPSLTEGFGLPVLEAMACGTPVLTSQAGGLTEAAGNAAHYFDPCNESDLEQKLDRLLSDHTLREKLRRAGFEQAASFTWERSAELVRGYLEGVSERVRRSER
jgi:glycosyltransferase involved in cell wall biosynthesis